MQKRVTVRIDENLYYDSRKIAALKQKSMNAIINHSIHEFVQKEKTKHVPACSAQSFINCL